MSALLCGGLPQAKETSTQMNLMITPCLHAVFSKVMALVHNGCDVNVKQVVQQILSTYVDDGTEASDQINMDDVAVCLTSDVNKIFSDDDERRRRDGPEAPERSASGRGGGSDSGDDGDRCSEEGGESATACASLEGCSWLTIDDTTVISHKFMQSLLDMVAGSICQKDSTHNGEPCYHVMIRLLENADVSP